MLNFDKASLLSVNQTNNFFGDGLFRYKTTQNFSVKGYICDLTNTYGVSGVLSGVEAFTRAADDFGDISINGHYFGQGRINNIAYNEGNWVRSTEYTVDFQIYKTGSLTLDGEFYSNVSGAFLNPSNPLDLLDSFAEEFNFTAQNSNQYNFEHSFNIRYLSGVGTNPITNSKALAEGLMTQLTPYGFIDSIYSGFYPDAVNLKRTESYNAITYETSYSERYDSQQNYEWRHNYTYNIDSDGVATVSENGFMAGLNGDGINSQINGAFNRCEDVYDVYNNSSAYLIDKRIKTAKLFDKYQPRAEYTVTFTDDQKYSETYQWDYTLSYDRAQNDIIQATENGTIVGFGVLGSSEKYDAAKAAYPNIIFDLLPRVTDFYVNFAEGEGTLGINPISISEGRSPYRGSISYSKTFTDDPSIVNEDPIKRRQKSTQTTYPVAVYTTFGIINEGDEGEKVQDQNQSEEGTVSFAINYNLKRNDKNTSSFNTALDDAVSESAAVKPGDSYIKSCSYSIDPLENSMSFDVSWGFANSKERDDTGLDIND